VKKQVSDKSNSSSFATNNIYGGGSSSGGNATNIGSTLVVAPTGH